MLGTFDYAQQNLNGKRSIIGGHDLVLLRAFAHLKTCHMLWPALIYIQCMLYTCHWTRAIPVITAV